MEQQTSFGALLRHFRKTYKYQCTQAEIAEKFGYSQETIRSWELGRRFPARDEVARLAELMKLDPDEIKRAIQVGRRHAHLDALPSSFQNHPVVHGDYLALLENEIHTHWNVYRTGGSDLASRGLNLWLRTIKSVTEEARGSIWHARTAALLDISYQLEGSICSDLLLYKQAHTSYNQAFHLAKELQDLELMAAALARRGVTYIQQERPKAALAYLNYASILVKDLPVPHLKRYLFKALSEAHAMLHRDDESSRSIDMIGGFLDHTGEVLERSHCQVNVSSVLAQKGVNAVLLQSYSDAITWIDQSLRTYNHAIVRGRARLVAQQAVASYGLRQIDKCTELGEEAYTLARAVGSRKTAERLQQLYVSLAKSRWRKETSVGRLGALLAMQ